jgi:hypothetical protein
MKACESTLYIEMAWAKLGIFESADTLGSIMITRLNGF